MNENFLIGKEIIGFKFPDNTNNIHYISMMDFNIGKRGKITKVWNEGCFVKFKNKSMWAYPISLIKDNLIENQYYEIY